MRAQNYTSLLPGEPGWEVLATVNDEAPYAIGSYLTVWPNLMLNVFPGAALALTFLVLESLWGAWIGQRRKQVKT